MGRRFGVMLALLWACGSTTSDAELGTYEGRVPGSGAASRRRVPSADAAAAAWTPEELADLLGARHVEDLPTQAVLARRPGATDALAQLAGAPTVAPWISARALHVWSRSDGTAALPTVLRVAGDLDRPGVERSAAVASLASLYSVDPARVTEGLIDVLRADDARGREEVALALAAAPWRSTFVARAATSNGLSPAARAVLTAR